MKPRMLDSLPRDLLLFVVISALVFPFAMAWGGPFVVKASSPSASSSSASSSSASSPSEVLAAYPQAQSAVFQGTVLRNGERFFLRASSGQIYQLDDSQHAQPFEGKNVRITGTLDSGAKLIHVARIDPA